MTLSTTVSSPPAVAPCFRAEELLRRQKQQRRQAEAKRKAEEQLQVQIRNPEQGVLVEVDDWLDILRYFGAVPFLEKAWESQIEERESWILGTVGLNSFES